MKAKWLFKNGAVTIECDSFPYAFRTMFHTVRKEMEGGKLKGDIIKYMSIISPLKDVYGNPKVYSYFDANTMAVNQGLLTPEGTINSREFKKR